MEALSTGLRQRTLSVPLVLLFVAVLFSVTGELLLKHGMNQNGVLELAPSTLLSTLFRVFTNPFILAGFILLFSGSIFWLAVISRVPLSYAYPLLSTSYILVVLASGVILGEHITWERIVGVLVIMLGVSLVFRSGQ